MPGPHPNPLPEPRQIDADRFWEKVRIGSEDECWPWTAATSNRGYGLFGRYDKRGGLVLATRMAFRMFYGGDPYPCYVLHQCDNPLCCNPEHLFLGTKSDNMQDCLSKGRHYSVTLPELILRGEAHGMARLTNSDVVAIRAHKVSPEAVATLAKQYQLNASTIRRIRARRLWKHID